jgi:hypothetical protein
MKLHLRILGLSHLSVRLLLLRQSNLVLQSKQREYLQLRLAKRARRFLELRQLLQQTQRSLDTRLEQQLPVLAVLLGLLPQDLLGRLVQLL